MNITGEYLEYEDDREKIIFTVEPIKIIIDRESAYYDPDLNQWVETFSCGRISAYNKEKDTRKT